MEKQGIVRGGARIFQGMPGDQAEKSPCALLISAIQPRFQRPRGGVIPRRSILPPEGEESDVTPRLGRPDSLARVGIADGGRPQELQGVIVLPFAEQLACFYLEAQGFPFRIKNRERS